jgi:hypothetical protein
MRTPIFGTKTDAPTGFLNTKRASDLEAANEVELKSAPM